MFLQGLVGRQEDDPLFLQVLLEGVVHHLGVVLGADAGQEFALGLGDAQAVERLLDVVRHVLPRSSLAVGGLHVVVDVVEVDVLDPAAPRRGRLLLENFQGVEADVAHPARLALDFRHLRDDVLVQALAGAKDRLVRVVKTELVVALHCRDFDPFFLYRRCHEVLLPCRVRRNDVAARRPVRRISRGANHSRLLPAFRPCRRRPIRRFAHPAGCARNAA